MSNELIKEELPITDSTGLFSKDEMVDAYLFGLDLSDAQGNPFPERMFVQHLNSAVAQVKRMLQIEIGKVEKVDMLDYYASDYANWGFMKLIHTPVLEITKLNLTYGQSEGMVIPNDWIKLDPISGTVRLFPASGSAGGLVITNGGVMMGLMGRWSHSPSSWRVEYTAGFTEETLPADLKELVYKQACINILNVFGDLILGAGIASQSIGLDGLSQSIGTTQSAMYGGASARVNAYQEDIKLLVANLKSSYTGPKMVVV